MPDPWDELPTIATIEPDQDTEPSIPYAETESNDGFDSDPYIRARQRALRMRGIEAETNAWDDLPTIATVEPEESLKPERIAEASRELGLNGLDDFEPDGSLTTIEKQKDQWLYGKFLEDSEIFKDNVDYKAPDEDYKAYKDNYEKFSKLREVHEYGKRGPRAELAAAAMGRLKSPEEREQFLESLRQGWKQKGPIEANEQLNRTMAKNPAKVIPILGGVVDTIEMVKTKLALKAIKEEQSGGQKLSEKDRKAYMRRLNSFVMTIEESKIRGSSIGADITEGALELFPFVVELVVTGGTDPAIKNAVLSGGKKLIKKSLVKGVKTGILKTGLRTTAATAKFGTQVAGYTAIHAGDIIERTTARFNINDKAKIEVTKKGDGWAKAIAKAYTSNAIEILTEKSGGLIGKGLGKVGSSFVNVGKGSAKAASSNAFAKRLIDGIQKSWMAKTGKTASDFAKLALSKSKGKLSKFGLHGVIEEMGEERLGDVLRAVVNLEGAGNTLSERLIDSIPDSRQILTEAGIFAIPIGGSLATTGASEAGRYIDSKKKKNLKDAWEKVKPDQIKKLSELDDGNISRNNIKKALGYDPKLSAKGRVDFVYAAKLKVYEETKAKMNVEEEAQSVKDNYNNSKVEFKEGKLGKADIRGKTFDQVLEPGRIKEAMEKDEGKKALSDKATELQQNLTKNKMKDEIVPETNTALSQRITEYGNELGRLPTKNEIKTKFEGEVLNKQDAGLEIKKAYPDGYVKKINDRQRESKARKPVDIKKQVDVKPIENIEITPNKKNITEEELKTLSSHEIVRMIPAVDPSKKASDYTRVEAAAELYRSPIEGMPLPNKRAFKEAKKLKVQVNIDGDALKYVNDGISHESGNILLNAIGEALQSQGIEGYHVSGDEFQAQFNSEVEAKSEMSKALNYIQDSTLVYIAPNGDKYEHQGAGFSYGIGSNTNEAEEKLKSHKLQREREGTRASRGEKPSGLVQITSKGRDLKGTIQGQEEFNRNKPIRERAKAAGIKTGGKTDAGLERALRDKSGQGTFKEIRQGAETKIVDIAGNEEVPAKYVLIEAKDVIPSHDFRNQIPTKRSDYPTKLQPRNYDAKSENAQKVFTMAGQKKAGLFINTTPSMNDGPPVISSQNHVIAGNGRTMSLQVAYRKGQGKWYKSHLEANAETYGLTVKEIKGMKQPILVRAVDTESTSELAMKFSRTSNIGNTYSESSSKEAANLKDVVSDDVLNDLKNDEQGTFSQLVNDPSKGRAIRESISKGIPDSQRSRYFTDSGALTAQGKDFVQELLFTKVFSTEVIEKMPPALKNKIEGAVPQLIMMKRGQAVNVIPQMEEAVKFWVGPLDSGKQSVEDYEGQGVLFGEKESLSPEARMMLDFIMDSKPTEFRKKLGTMIRTLEQEGAGSLLGALDPETDSTAIARTLGVKERDGAKFGQKGRGAKGASIYRYDGEVAKDKESLALGMPELVRLSRDLNAGKMPSVMENLRKRGALGVFWHTGAKAKIDLKADIFIGPMITSEIVRQRDAKEAEKTTISEILEKWPNLDPEKDIVVKKEFRGPKTLIKYYRRDAKFAAKVFSHEIGHMVDWLPDTETNMARGNILGRVATLSGHLKHVLSKVPGESEVMTQKERSKIRREAEKAVGKKPKTGALLAEVDAWKRLVKAEFTKRFNQELEAKGLISKEQIESELKALTRWWSPWTEPAADKITQEYKDYVKYRESSPELYAEALSVLLNDPAALKKRAPLFHESFFAYLESKPAVNEAYVEIQTQIALGTSINLTRQDARKGFRAAEAEHNKILQKEKTTFSEIRDSIGTLFASNFYRVERFIKRKGKGFKTNALDLIEEAKYSGSQIEQYVRDMKETIFDEMDKNGIDMDTMGEYMLYKRSATERSEMAAPLVGDATGANRALEDLKRNLGSKKFKAVEDIQKKFTALRRDTILKEISESKVYDAELVDSMLENNYYATFDVVKHINGKFGKGNGAKIFKQIGTLNEIGNPLTATIQSDISLIRGIKWHKAKSGVASLLDGSGLISEAETTHNGKFITAKQPTDPKLELLSFMKHGKLESYYVPKDWSKMFENAIDDDLGLAVNVLRWSANPFRTIFVGANPGFWAANLVRDVNRTVINVKGAGYLNMIPKYLEAAKLVYGDTFGPSDATIKEMREKNILLTWANFDGLTTMDKQAERILAKYGQMDADISFWKEWIAKALVLSDMVEKTGKVAPYLYLKANQKKFGYSDSEVAHIVRTQAGSPSFNSKGSVTPITNNLALFSNPAIQGTRSNLEAFSDRPFEVGVKYLAYSIAPKVLMYGLATGAVGAMLRYLGADDEDEVVKFSDEMKKVFAGVTDYDMTNYTVIPMGLDASGKSVYLRIPNDENSRMFGGLFYQMLKGSTDGVGNTIQDGARYMGDQGPGLNPMFSLGASVYQYMTGTNPYDSFRRREAVPKTLFDAGGMASHKSFAKWISNNYGGGIIYKFKNDNPGEVKSELQKILDLPVSSNLIGRFVKVTDYGIREKANKVVQEERQNRAKEIIALQDIIKAKRDGETLSKEDKTLLNENKSYVKRYENGIENRSGSAVEKAINAGRTIKERAKIEAELDKQGLTDSKENRNAYILSKIKSLGTSIPQKRGDRRSSALKRRDDAQKFMSENKVTMKEARAIYLKYLKAARAKGKSSAQFLKNRKQFFMNTKG